MLKCFNCKGSAEGLESVIISIDGDMVCSERCKKEYEEKRDHFMSVIIHDDAKMEAWWGGNDRA